jgi:CheY-like chemotaxis protein
MIHREDTVEEDRSQEGRKHVFVINGSPDFLDIVRELFQEEGYNVTTTNFVPRSFEQIEALQPDVLIVDVVLGKQAGWELLERLHSDAATTGIPVLVVSTDPALLVKAQEQAERYGHHTYLEKPFSIDAILAEIEALIGKA